MSRPVRFALVGKSGSGKSHAGEFLSEKLKISHVKTGAICRQIARLLFDNEDKRSTQILDDALTAIDPSIFFRAALRPVREEESFVIDSLRFRDDLMLAKKHGCRVIRIVAPDDARLIRLKERGQVFNPISDGAHRSEIELDDAEVDFKVINNADLATFEEALSTIAAQF